jgi:hypothetical protein
LRHDLISYVDNDLERATIRRGGESCFNLIKAKPMADEFFNRDNSPAGKESFRVSAESKAAFNASSLSGSG